LHVDSEETMKDDRGPPVIACSLEQEELLQRRARWQALRTQAGIETAHIECGLRITFRARADVAEELEALVALERECCAFADWLVRHSDGKLVLEITGDGVETIAAVQAMFRGDEDPFAQLDLGHGAPGSA
jgi:hypothetical protein